MVARPALRCLVCWVSMPLPPTSFHTGGARSECLNFHTTYQFLFCPPYPLEPSALSLHCCPSAFPSSRLLEKNLGLPLLSAALVSPAIQFQATFSSPVGNKVQEVKWEVQATPPDKWMDLKTNQILSLKAQLSAAQG